MDSAIDKTIKTVMKSLKANRFDPVEFAETADDAREIVLDMITPEAVLGFAGSTTVSQIGLADELRERGTKGFDLSELKEIPLDELMRRPSDILLASSNAVTLDGKLVNIDGTGNRVSGMIFGPKKVILVIGMNKIVRDVTEAIDRVKNVIAPYHAMVLQRKTPCATTGRCTDCESPERICNVTTVIEKKPSLTDIAIVLVGEDLGLGWDPDWPEERKEGIVSVYRRELEKLFSFIMPDPS
jgi:L-lactate utilization protein LutB